MQVQQFLRKTPGIPAAQSEEIISNLRETGQVVSQELGLLVDAVVQMKLDADEGKVVLHKVKAQLLINKSNADNSQDQNAALLRVNDRLKAELVDVRRIANRYYDQLHVVTAQLESLRENKESDTQDATAPETILVSLCDFFLCIVASTTLTAL